MQSDSVIDQLVKAFYSPRSTSALTQNAVRSFREAAGFTKGFGVEKDKWLQTLSVDDTLEAVLSAFTNSTPEPEKLSQVDLDVFKNLCLEKGSLTANPSLEKSIAYGLRQQNETEALSCMSKMFLRLNQRLMNITPETLLTMSRSYPKLLDLCYDSYKKACGNSSNHWLITSSFQSPQLYNTFCDYMLKAAPCELPTFISLCSKRGKLFSLYADQEQSIVFLIETVTCFDTEHSKIFTISKICENLLKIARRQPEVAVKLLHHFPCLGDWIVECSDESEAAGQVCLWTLTLNPQ